MPNPQSVQDVREPVHAQLFMLRMWREELGEGRIEWRGKVQHVTSGEVRYFRDWPALIACLQEMSSAKPDQI
ncbi:MAG TPA: hypothetical protein VLG46_02570 [Anaerolineae bacterium]|nr:hypothetical protein [Anaerolineae bacterium]